MSASTSAIQRDLDDHFGLSAVVNGGAMVFGAGAVVLLSGMFGRVTAATMAWVVVTVVICVSYGALGWAVRSAPRSTFVRRGAAVAGAANGPVIPLFVTTVADVDDSTGLALGLLVIVLCTNIGAVPGFASHLRAGQVFLSMQWLVTIGLLVWMGEPILVVAAVIVAVAAVGHHRIGYQTSVEAITNRHQTEELSAELRRSEALAWHNARHDSLTGLRNRAGLLEGLAGLPAGCRVGVLYVDLDLFKEVNDVHGHAAGDRLLREVGERLASLPDVSLVARLGGDEFVVVTGAVGGFVEIDTLAHEALERIERPVVLGSAVVGVSASIGVAVVVPGSAPVEELLAEADAAMYRAKAGGTEHVVHFDVSLALGSARTEALAAELAEAVEAERFGVGWRPLRCGARASWMAEARWARNGSEVAPEVWRPVFDRLGRQHQLGRLMVDRAARRVIADPDGVVWVPVDSIHLAGGGLADDLRLAVDRYAVPPGRLGIVVAEVDLLDAERARWLGSVAEVGIAVAVELGGGPCSMRVLAEHGIDALIVGDGADEVVEAMVAWARTVGIATWEPASASDAVATV